MGIFDFLKVPDINEGVARCMSTPGAALIDVRSRGEYASGHVPGSRNIPLDQLEDIRSQLPTQNTPLFVYCLSGGRSRQAASRLLRMGYKQVHNIGGIANWRGRKEA